MGAGIISIIGVYYVINQQIIEVTMGRIEFSLQPDRTAVEHTSCLGICPSAFESSVNLHIYAFNYLRLTSLGIDLCNIRASYALSVAH